MTALRDNAAAASAMLNAGAITNIHTVRFASFLFSFLKGRWSALLFVWLFFLNFILCRVIF